ncbi:MAG TPA: electron transfer flavoprotein subunit beta/FixA family protein [Thermoplasmata archaeon]|nr:electron transfer flavoprotein subunit beta/FixA family protein [Thermoplasmata archaeon]
MEILVLVKPVPEAESRLRPSTDGRLLDPEGIKFVLAGYDESAVEQALLLKEAQPGSHVRAIAFGPPPRSEEVLRSALALGCDSATWVELPAGRTAEPAEAARELARACAKYPHDLVLVGKQAGDDELGLMASAVGARLGHPSFNGVVDLRLDAASGRFKFQRALENGSELWETPGPVVIGLQQAWNDPRTAKLQNILKSRKTPIDKVAEEAPPSTEPPWAPVAFRLPPPRTGAKMIEYTTPDEAAAKLTQLLAVEAKVLP